MCQHPKELGIKHVSNPEQMSLTPFCYDWVSGHGSWAVRDVWAHKGAGALGAGGTRTIALGVHESALFVLTPEKAKETFNY